MNQQPKRMLKRVSRSSYYAHPCSTDNSKAGGDEWIGAYPKTNTKKCDSDTDDNLRLGQKISSRKRSKKSGKKSSKSIKPPKTSVLSWNDGCSSDDGSENDISARKVKNKGIRGKASRQSITKKSASQSSKREGRKNDGNSSISDSDIGVEEVKKKGKTKKSNQSITKKASAQSSKHKRETKHKFHKDCKNRSNDSESDTSVVEVKKIGHNNKKSNRKEPNQCNIKTPTSQSNKRRSKYSSRKGDGNSSSSSSGESDVIGERKKTNKKPLNQSKNPKNDDNSMNSSSGSESDMSVEEVKKKHNGKKANKKAPNQSSIRKRTAQLSKREDNHKRRKNDGSSSSSDNGNVVVVEKVKKKGITRKHPDRSNIKKPISQSSKREVSHKSQKKIGNSSSSDSSSRDSENDSIVEEVAKKGLNKNTNKRPPGQSRIGNPTTQPSKRKSRINVRKHDDNSSSSSSDSSSSDSESDDSVEEVKTKFNNNERSKKSPNQSNIKNNTAQPNNREDTHKSQDPKTIKRTSFKKITSAGLREPKTPYNAPSREIVKLAETKANRAIIPEDITSVSQLQWYRIRLLQTEERTRETIKPCRVLSHGEAIEYRRKNNNSNMNGKTTVIQYLATFPDVDNGLYKGVDDSSLVPFGYPSKDGLSTTLNDDYLQRYLQQEVKKNTAINLEATRLFLKRVFKHARDTQKNSRDQANKDLNAFYADSSSDEVLYGHNAHSSEVAEDKRVQFELAENSDDDVDVDNIEMDDLDVPYTQAITFDPDDFGNIEERSNEPIRPGDVIEYYSPIFVAGDSRGLRQVSVLAVDQIGETPLVLSNGEVIPSNTKVKRIKVMLEGELVDHPGIFRPIYRFKLVKKGSATAADAIAMEASRFGRIMQKQMSKLKEKAQADGFAPMDLLVNMKGVDIDTSGAKAPSGTKSSTAISTRGKEPESLVSSSSDDSDDTSHYGNKIPKQGVKMQTKKNPKMIAAATSNNANREKNDTASGGGKRMRLGYLSSSSSDDSDDTSHNVDRKSKQRVKMKRKETPPTTFAATMIKVNKENKGNASGKGKRMSLGYLSSSASLGPSLASSDDSSIESTPVKLGRNSKEATCEKFVSSECKKADAKYQDSEVVKLQRKKTPRMNIDATINKANKENNGTASGKGKRMSLGSLSISASLGPSLASSDDSSIDSTPVILGRRSKEIAYEKSASSKFKKAGAEYQDNKTPSKKRGGDKCKPPSKSRPFSVLRSPNSDNSQSSLETPNSSGLRRQPDSKRSSSASSIVASIGSSKRRLKLGTASKNKKVVTSLLMLDNSEDEKDSARKARRPRELVPLSSPPPANTSASTSASKLLRRKQGKATPEIKSKRVFSAHTYSSDSVQIVNDCKSKPTTKETPSSSYNLFSSDSSDGNCEPNTIHVRGSKSKKLLPHKQSSYSSGAAKGQWTSKSGQTSARELPPAKHETMNSLGWAQGKAGWKKKSTVGDTGSSGFGTIGRFK